MRNLILLCVILLFFSACSKSEESSEAQELVIFDSQVDDYSRAVSTFGPITLASLQASADGFAVSTSGLPARQMNNLVVKYTGGKWGYTGNYYWPLIPSQNVTFTAYAPAGTPGVTMTASGITLTGFTPAAAPGNQIDLLYAPPATFNRGTSGVNGVALRFNHLLTQIVFSINTVSILNITSINRIVLTVPNPIGAYSSAGVWTNSGTTASYTITLPGGKTPPIISTPVLMVPKATIPAGTQATIYYNVLGTGIELSITRPLNILTSVTSWRAGYKVTYNITLNGLLRSADVEATEEFRTD